MRFLKQSTSVDLPIGPFLDDTDGKTAETALTLTQPDIRLKKNGSAWAQKAAAQTLSHEEFGNYEVTLDATDTDTLGHLRLHIAETGALPVWEDFMVLPANVYDSLFAGTDTLQVDVAEWLGTAAATPTIAGVPEVDITHLGGVAQSLLDLKDFADDGYDPTTNKASVDLSSITSRIGSAIDGTGVETIADAFETLANPAKAVVPTFLSANFNSATDSLPKLNDTMAAIGLNTDTALADLDAIETILTAIKGAGWTTETLVTLQDAINLRLLTSGYTAPDNATIAAIDAKTTNLPATPANETTVASRLSQASFNTFSSTLTTTLTNIAGQITALPTAILAATVDSPFSVLKVLQLTKAIMTGNYTSSLVGTTRTTTYYMANGSTVIAISTVDTTNPISRTWTFP